MSLKLRVKVSPTQMPSRFVVKVSGCDVVFAKADDATKFYLAAQKSLGEERGIEFKAVDGETGEEHSNYITGIVPFDGDKLTVRSERLGTEGEILSKTTTERYIRCDGVPKGDGSMCGCWYTHDGDEESLPDDWETYYVNGVPRHMCPRCQVKDVKVEKKLVVETSC